MLGLENKPAGIPPTRNRIWTASFVLLGPGLALHFYQRMMGRGCFVLVFLSLPMMYACLLGVAQHRSAVALKSIRGYVSCGGDGMGIFLVAYIVYIS